MGKSKSVPMPAAPSLPDPRVTAGLQTGTNIATAIAQQNLNNMNQVTPWGSLTYNQTGQQTYTDPASGKTYSIPRYTATQTLSPEQQAIFDRTQAAKGSLAGVAQSQAGLLQNVLGRPVDFSGLPERGDISQLQTPEFNRLGEAPVMQGQIGDAGDITKTYGTDFSADRQRVEDALMQRLDPSLERDRSALETRLANQGIRMGSEAYGSAMDDLGRQRSDARLGAILGAGREQSRLAALAAQRAAFQNAAQQQAFGQQQARAGFSNQAEQQSFANAAQRAAFNNQLAAQEANAAAARYDAQNAARQSALQEQLLGRNQPLNEMSALLSGSQVRDPNFITPQTAQIPTTDFAGIQAANNANRMSAWQTQSQLAAQQNAQRQGMFSNLMGGLFGLGSAFIRSDRRTKTGIQKIAQTKDGLPLYKFQYKGGGPIQIGLMAQDVEKTKPEAVADVGGVKMVNYGIALGR